MEKFIILLSVLVCFLAIFVFDYKIVTDNIIKDQDRELARLRTENKRLRNHINYLNHAARSGHNIAPVDPEQVGIKFTVINPEAKAVLNRLFEQW